MNEIRQQIGQRIRAIMDEQGISTGKLAEMTGLHQPNVQRVISGKNSIGIEKLTKIAAALNCTVEIVQGVPESESGE